MSIEDDWIVARRGTTCTVYTTLWHVGEVYAQIEEYDTGRIVTCIRRNEPKKRQNSMLDWTAHDTVDEAKEWCIAQLTKHRLTT